MYNAVMPKRPPLKNSEIPRANRKRDSGTVVQPNPLLDPIDIVETTAELARKAGFGRLSMRQIAAELNVSATALYYHFRDKTALLEAVAAHILKSGEIPDGRLPWTRRLKELILWQQRTMLEYPGLANFIVVHRESAAGLCWMEMILRVLDDAGFRGIHAMRALGALSFFVHPLTLVNDRPHKGHPLALHHEWLSKQIAREPDRYPSLQRFLPSLTDYSYDALLPIALDRVIDGLVYELEHAQRTEKSRANRSDA